MTDFAILRRGCRPSIGRTLTTSFASYWSPTRPLRAANGSPRAWRLETTRPPGASSRLRNGPSASRRFAGPESPTSSIARRNSPARMRTPSSTSTSARKIGRERISAPRGRRPRPSWTRRSRPAAAFWCTAQRACRARRRLPPPGSCARGARRLVRDRRDREDAALCQAPARVSC